MTSKEEALSKVFKKCPYYGHRRLEQLLWFLVGVSVGISVGYYLFWYLLLSYMNQVMRELLISQL